ncbi:putative quinol monooxygenase [Gluconobacter oxydans]|uniref:ABM domain-containing protein n=1 Tax=Gluconobacter oxydans (strain 621H) TaxID=290633 RepID=Q5FSN1_GLUOX|nr:antibiotic biosynthesis monooxygenase [Gluconobacter oxydans]AAW60615.1 Hypothetical protein GOX0841 [Gluconobacter oxydans 621H]TCW28056.1 antibiotic biosynthesis monooxygenase [Gluconobacter oxydans]GEC60266.1 hypothetical protein GOX01_05970 [Gluconobacter oxydans]
MAKSLYATLKALPGKRETLRALLTKLAGDVRAEPGCERFMVYTLASDPDLFHVEETYRDDAATWQRSTAGCSTRRLRLWLKGADRKSSFLTP